MANKSKNIIDKIVKKDYNNELEEIMSLKNYDENVKNLLLDILYKVETSYKDYSKVKQNVLTQEKYIRNILGTINNKCDKINLIKPNLKNDNQEIKKTVVDKEKKEIICYPILTKLLYAISEMKKSENILKEEDSILNKTITRLINVGNNINTVEPLRDFNGFSWNIITKDIENLYYNLIYQDLIILNGNTFFEKWCNQNKTNIDYLEELSFDLNKQYGKKTQEEIIELIKILSVLIVLNEKTSIVKQIYEENLQIKEQLKNIEDSQKYIVDISEKKKKLNERIRQIDIIINDKELLEKEYKRRNDLLSSKNKIFSAKVLEKMLKEERQNIIRKIGEYNYLMNPKNIITKQTKLKEKLKYRSLIEVKNTEREIYKNIILLQKIVIECINLKIENCTSKQTLISLMYQLRYLGMLPIKEKQCINEVPELEKILNLAKNNFYLKANELNMTNEIFNDMNLNMHIFSHIFKTKIISLEDISIKIAKMKDQWYVQFFDEGVTDETFKIDKELNGENIKIKMNKTIKLFNL